MVESGVAHG